MLNDYIKELENSELVSATPKKTKKQIRLVFSPKKPPQEAGVYVVYHCGKSGNEFPKSFYVGEARDLRQRLTMLFRCNSSQNPHPCQLNFAAVVDEKITDIECVDFCEQCKVRFLSTENLVGRIEIEEKLQEKYGTNCDAFYKRFADETID
jgi:hypothetical protein